MKIAPESIFEVIKGGPKTYVQSMDFCDKTIAQAERMLPEGFNIQYQSKKSDYADQNEHPFDEQYAILANDDPNTIFVHLYVNAGVIQETEEINWWKLKDWHIVSIVLI